jgi:hypothetical protein
MNIDYIGNNKIEDEGTKAIGHALESNKNLNELYLSNKYLLDR